MDNSFVFEKCTAVIGKNASGKTNLIEAVRLLSILKPFRAKKQEEAIAYLQNEAVVSAQVSSEEGDKKIAVLLSHNGKQVKIDRKKLPISRAVGTLKTVLFSPEDSMMIFGPPSKKRKYIDAIISQKKKIYLDNLIKYHKALKQRNSLLFRLAQRGGNPSDLVIWDLPLCELSDKIQDQRKDLFRDFNSMISQKYIEISSQKNAKLEIKYFPSLASPKLLLESRAKDIRYQNTNLGAHHDEIKMFLGSKLMDIYASRGEQRSAILALKHAEIDYLSTEKKDKVIERPVLLLDDIFSELDAKRRENILNMLDKQQTIITATSLSAKIKNICQKVIEI